MMPNTPSPSSRTTNPGLAGRLLISALVLLGVSCLLISLVSLAAAGWLFLGA